MDSAEPIDHEDTDAAHEPQLLAWRRIRVQGRRAEYGEAGDGVPVVFLHGWGLSNRTYRRALKRLLGHDVRVVAPALPGFGNTAELPARDHTIEGYARWLDAFFEAAGVHEPAVVMGHSFGGGCAIKLAHDHPHCVRSLVLVNSVGGSVWSQDGSVVKTMAERPLWDWGLHFPRDILPGRQISRVLPVIVRDAVPNIVRHPIAFMRTADLARFADLGAELEELKRRGLPIIVLWGDQDRIIPRASTEALSEAAGTEVTTVPGAHSWLLADPDAFGEVMTNVIEAAQRARDAEDAEAAFARKRRPRASTRLRTMAHPKPADEQ